MKAPWPDRVYFLQQKDGTLYYHGRLESLRNSLVTG